MSQLDEVLRFWFERSPAESDVGKYRKVWFSKDPSFDQEIRSRFESVYKQAAAGELNSWQKTPVGCLALVLLLDQFPRNMFRGQPQAFATDDQARAVTAQAIACKFDQALPPVQRWFLYMPLMHSENLADQNQCVELFQTLEAEPDVESGSYAVKHRDIIQRFGRFPHRNQILGRTTTPEEAEFLKQRGSSF